jgi:hypothetical protein
VLDVEVEVTFNRRAYRGKKKKDAERFRLVAVCNEDEDMSRKIYTVVLRLNPEAKMVRFTQLRRSNIFSENACLILTGVLRYLGLDAPFRTPSEVSLSEAIDPHVNRRRLTEV